MIFLQFLMQSRSTLDRHLNGTKVPNTKMPKLNLVVGSESCDLDSAVSALAMAFVYAQRLPHNDYVPILNIPREDYPLKTEVVHMLSKYDIDQKVLLFKDDVPQPLGSEIRVILVDHNCSPLAANVVQVIDHHPLTPAKRVLLPTACVRHIETIARSCATIIAQYFFNIKQQAQRSLVVARLLHATIVLDTINFSPAVQHFSYKDLATVMRLEELLKERIESRYELFAEVVEAREDISRLTSVQALRKDMKELDTAQQKVPTASLPILALHFIDKSDAEQSIRQFAGDANLLVILGMYLNRNGLLKRDIALISPTGQTHLVDHIRRTLLEVQQPELELTPHRQATNFMGGCFLRQHNLQVTRKVVLRIVKSALLQWEESNPLTLSPVEV